MATKYSILWVYHPSHDQRSFIEIDIFPYSTLLTSDVIKVFVFERLLVGLFLYSGLFLKVVLPEVLGHSLLILSLPMGRSCCSFCWGYSFSTPPCLLPLANSCSSFNRWKAISPYPPSRNAFPSLLRLSSPPLTCDSVTALSMPITALLTKAYLPINKTGQ